MADEAPERCLCCGLQIRLRPSKRGAFWVSVLPHPLTNSAVICPGPPVGSHRPNRGPEDGHTFRVRVESRGSYAVAGVEGHADAGDFEQLLVVVEVRAWNLRDALSRAAHHPLSTWFPDEDEDGTHDERT